MTEEEVRKHDIDGKIRLDVLFPDGEMTTNIITANLMGVPCFYGLIPDVSIETRYAVEIAAKFRAVKLERREAVV